MRLLLDTNALLWFLAGSKRMSPSARRAIENARNAVHISAISGYEIAFKRSLGPRRLEIAGDVATYVRQQHLIELPVTLDHSVAAGELPLLHRDPWDRVLVAQSKLEGLILVSADEAFESYGVKVLW